MPVAREGQEWAAPPMEDISEVLAPADLGLLPDKPMVPFIPFMNVYCPGCGTIPSSMAVLEKHVFGNGTGHKACPQFLLHSAYFLKCDEVRHSAKRNNGSVYNNPKLNYLRA